MTRPPGRPKGLPKSGGRAKGVPNKATASTRLRIEAQADPIGFLIGVANGEATDVREAEDDTKQRTVFPTLEQRMHAASLLARKIAPDARDNPIRLSLPAIDTPAGVLAALDVVAQAMARGEITPSEAQTVAAVLEAKRKTIETVELERRLAALEGARA